MQQQALQLDTPSTCFVTIIRTAAGARAARIAVESLRTYGGAWKDAVVIINLVQPGMAANHLEGIKNIRLRVFQPDKGLLEFPFYEKVSACSQTEEMVAGEFNTMVWIDPNCLFVNPPRLFYLDDAVEVAFRPVHIRNIGSVASEALDEFWQTIYARTGVAETGFTVESFVDSAVLRPYFNTHCFSIQPDLGLCRLWRDGFRDLVLDERFQSAACHDEVHKVFLHQAVLSALIVKSIPRQNLRLLPAEYNYPLHLHQKIPVNRQANKLSSLVNPVYEEVFDYPKTMSGISVEEPLHSWLKQF